MAHSPDPTIMLTTVKGVTRTLDDWLTVFHLCLICLPGRPEAQAFVRPARKVLEVFRDADCTTAILVTGNDRMVVRLVGTLVDEYVIFRDPESDFVKAKGLSRLPAFVHIGGDGSLLDVAEGWDPQEWTRVATSLAKWMSWTHPVLGPGDTPPHPGWSP